MNISVSELSQRLQRALDSNYNVIDMGTVVEILSHLERISVTKEQLETTRLAKSFNELRRKTTDVTLAKRSKDLLKKWRKMILPTTQPMSSGSQSQSVLNTVSQPNSPENNSRQLNSLPSTFQPPAGLLGMNINSNSSQSIRFSLMGGNNQYFSHNLSNNNNNNNNNDNSQDGPTNFKNVFKTSPVGAMVSPSPQQPQSQPQPLPSSQQIQPKYPKQQIQQQPQQLQSTQMPFQNANANARTPVLGKRPYRTANNAKNNNNDTNSNFVDDSQDNEDSDSQRYAKKIRRPNYVNGCALSAPVPNPVPSNFDVLSIKVPNSESVGGNMAHPDISPPPSLNPPMDDIMIINSDSCNSNSQNIANSKQHKHKKHKKSRDKKSSSASKYNKSQLQPPSQQQTMSADMQPVEYQMPQIRNSEPYLISDSMSDQSSSMSGFPAAYHQQLQQQHLISAPPPRDIKKQLSFSGLFRSTSQSQDNSTGSNAVDHSPSFYQAETRSQSPHYTHRSNSNSCLPNPPVVNVIPPPSNQNSNSQKNNLENNVMTNSNHGASAVTSPVLKPVTESQPVTEKKKRGRRKGSKGIDSTLAEASKMLGAELGSHLPSPYNSRTATPTAAIFASGGGSCIGSTTTSPAASYSNAYNDIKNKIASASGTKKVKTTKELLADLQNRKNNNTTDMYSSVSQSIVSPSSSSEMSLQSQFTEVGSRSTMVTPEPRLLPSISTSQLPTIKQQTVEMEPPLTQAQLLQQQLQQEGLSAVDDEIRKLKAQLPPIDYSVLDEDPYACYDDDGQPILCTCSFKEVTVLIDPLTGKEVSEEDGKPMNGSEEDTETDTKIHINIVKSEMDDDNDDDQENHIMDDDSDDNDDDFCIVDTKSEVLIREDEKPDEKPVENKPRVKSIFDDDYDDDNDPIYSFLSENNNKVSTETDYDKLTNSKVAKKAENKQEFLDVPINMIDDPTQNSQLLPTAQRTEPQPFTKWVCEEDPDCPAKHHFDFDDKVNGYHVKMVHDCYIPNINGNWNGLGVEESPEQPNDFLDYKYQFDNIDYEKHKLFKRVVPSYNHLVLDKIPKVVDDWQSAIKEELHSEHMDNGVAIKSEIDSDHDDADNRQSTDRLLNHCDDDIYKNSNLAVSCNLNKLNSKKLNNRNVIEILDDDDDRNRDHGYEHDDLDNMMGMGTGKGLFSYSDEEDVLFRPNDTDWTIKREPINDDDVICINDDDDEEEEHDVEMDQDHKKENGPTDDGHSNNVRTESTDRKSLLLPDAVNCSNNGLLNSFNNLNTNNLNGINSDRNTEFKEWYQIMNVKSYNDDILTILPYVVID